MLMLLASMYGSSPGAAIVTLPELAPAAMVMLSPLSRVTVIAVSVLLSTLAV